MIIKNIMVHLDSSERAAYRLEQAVGLAGRFDARLVGVFAETDASLLGRSAEREVQAAYEAVGTAFHAQAEAAGIKAVWRSLVHGSHHQVIQTVIDATRRADLAVLGQHDREARDGRAPADLAEQVLINSGRPALVIPYVGSFPTIGSRVVIAWNGGRESARAANDSIPFLRGAETVRIMALNPGGTPLDGAGLTEHLACHGIACSREMLEVKDIGVADYVLSHCADLAADLLVMGAFGHMGFPHVLRGGVTRDILAHMTLPVLMSH